jgi:16S rRNA (adenine1518-N6/adenine1519-N6)-dimethyltransferase
LFARVENLFTLPPEAFDPPPEVYSSVLRLTMEPRMTELQVDADRFQAILKLAFAQKRKTLANNLKGTFNDKAIRAALKEAGVRPDARAEALPLDKMAAIFRALEAA